MNLTPTQQLLSTLHACSEARSWVGEQSLNDAWKVCPRPDWMLWYIGREQPMQIDSPERRKLVGVAAE